ncbi:MAG: hypothetical protein Ct9H300mP15_24960 [Gemmatimonadota bacterium]|nr:MAG: hypothetical protein Ct9H300mP15_24960 [Gemmatimonadota bacterium]
MLNHSESIQPLAITASGDGRATSPNELLREEIFRDGEADPTAYELVQRLRPNWLRARGQVSLGSQRQPMHSCT